MKFDDILNDLKNKIYKPIYLLMGDEPYYTDQITNYIVNNILEESEKAFNQIVMYGKDTEVGSIDNAARRFPMMSNYQVVVVKEAQDLKRIDDLVYYAQNPLKSTILVINYKYKTISSQKKLYKAIDKCGVILASKKLYDNQVPAWINKYLKEKKYEASPEVGLLLTEFLGNNLSKVANELDKLMITLPEGTQITPELIERNIGISKDYNNFELQKALGLKNILKANRIVDHFSKNQKSNPLVVTIITLFNFFSKVLCYHYLNDKSTKNAASVLKVNPYFLKDYIASAKNYGAGKTIQIISLLREYDAKSKGIGNVSASPGALLKELVFKIMH